MGLCKRWPKFLIVSPKLSLGCNIETRARSRNLFHKHLGQFCPPERRNWISLGGTEEGEMQCSAGSIPIYKNPFLFSNYQANTSIFGQKLILSILLRNHFFSSES